MICCFVLHMCLTSVSFFYCLCFKARTVSFLACCHHFTKKRTISRCWFVFLVTIFIFVYDMSMWHLWCVHRLLGVGLPGSVKKNISHYEINIPIHHTDVFCFRKNKKHPDYCKLYNTCYVDFYYCFCTLIVVIKILNLINHGIWAAYFSPNILNRFLWQKELIK